MFDFQDLFQWDRFISPDRTDTRKRSDILRDLDGSSLMGRL